MIRYEIENATGGGEDIRMKPWLPSMPASVIDTESVAEFLRQGHPESNTHEYKIDGQTARLGEVISGLANTYGGIAVVGVPDEWTGDLATLGHIDAEAESRIVDRLVDNLDPSSWLPTFIPVVIDGHRLLVLKIDLADAPRPLLARGRAYLKRQSRTVPAGWLDLRSLFAEQKLVAPAAPAIHNRNLNSSQQVLSFLDGGTNGPDFTLRLVAGCAAWPPELSGKHADARLRNNVLSTLKSTDIDRWLRRYASNVDLAAPERWREAPPSGVGTASFVLATSQRLPGREGIRAAVHIQLDIAQHPYGPSGGGITVTIDLMLWAQASAEDRSIAHTDAIQQGQLHKYFTTFSVSDLGDVLDSLTCTSQDILRTVSDLLLETPPSGFAGPICWATGELDKIWDISRVTHRRPATTPLGNHRAFDQAASFPTTVDERTRLIDHWLQVLLLATGHVPEGPLWKP